VWHGPFKRQTLEALRDCLRTIRAAGVVDDPILWLHGEADELVPIAGSRRGWSDLAGRHASAKSYPDARHEILNETNREVVLDDILDFIHAHLPAPPP
jgi:alpha-beta hydrolase superfamily lysophospholipase